MAEPFKSVCISTRLRRATRKANAIYDHAMEKHGITIAQLSLLRTIRRLERPTLNQLAQATELDASTLGRNMRVLEKAGLTRFEPGQDKRTRVLSLTEKGDAITDRANHDWDRVQSDLKSRLGPGGFDTLFQLLDALDPDNEGRST
ncbi:MarR family winged helix-turn-helix transcriptional regulator [Aestuariivita boseongensis]|uniref:MarR family winged helix-turn-helix transcriptional regulator n=1 Tax=Aestuariivita boseongensis TaxID=1470562 RepID=UPI0006808AC0|nr:MarR family transcriptional regulator [Aestuariivita boseongensis]